MGQHRSHPKAIAQGIGGDAQALTAAESTQEALIGTDLIVPGAPVLAFHLSSDRIRPSIAARPEPGAPTPDMSHPSLQAWLDALAPGKAPCAAVDRRRTNVTDHRPATAWPMPETAGR
jgi:hypothetical protein